MTQATNKNPLFSRRGLIKALGLGAAATMTAGLASRTLAATVPHIVVVGGGFAGATAAKYLKMWGGTSVEVTLIEPNATYVSPILSNLVLNGQRSTANLSFGYATHQQRYGMNVIHSSVTAIDKTAQSLALANGTTLNYDRLVLAPGIDFILAPGHDTAKVPHAWKAGVQTDLLKSQLDAMPAGGTFVMTIPAAPYRCPPGPYERACVVADFLRRRDGVANVIVLDANAGITVEADTFGAAFANYGVRYQANATVTAVNSDARSVTYNNATTLNADVLNVIPEQKAGSIIFAAGLNSGNWAPINPLTYESTLANNIHIIGDSQGTGVPKAGHIGNSEAKVCADAILRSLSNLAADPAPKINSACYSPISSNTASWLTAVYRYNSATGQMEIVPNVGLPAAGAPSTRNYSNMFNWAGNLFADTFA